MYINMVLFYGFVVIIVTSFFLIFKVYTVIDLIAPLQIFPRNSYATAIRYLKSCDEYACWYLHQCLHSGFFYFNCFVGKLVCAIRLFFFHMLSALWKLNLHEHHLYYGKRVTMHELLY